MAGRGIGKLARAVIVPPPQDTLFTGAGDAVADALSSGRSVERYQRIWRVGGAENVGGVLFGRLGFESTHAQDLWDPELQDFEEVEVPGGVAAPFAIRLRDLRVIFQVRSPFIRINSFVGAVRTLLRDATGQPDWRVVESGQESMEFETWRRSVSRITRLRVRLDPPNPNYEGRPSVRRLIEEAHAASATLDLRAENLDVDSDIVRELLDHVRRGYGDGTVVGEREIVGGEVETVYSTGLEGATELTERETDSDTGEVDRETLTDELD